MLDREFEDRIEAQADKIRQLTSSEGYFLRVYEFLPDLGTLRASWEATEREREELGLPERYTSYESFRRGKSYHHERRIFRFQ